MWAWFNNKEYKEKGQFVNVYCFAIAEIIDPWSLSILNVVAPFSSFTTPCNLQKYNYSSDIPTAFNFVM